jgi:hypothetical protein
VTLGNLDANVPRRVRMGLTALLFSGLGDKGQFGRAATHKAWVAEFYRCWCFSATTLVS